MVTDAGSAVLALVAAIWARESTRTAGFERLNGIRDQIILGRREGERLSRAHKELMFRGDWWPSALSVITVTALFAVVVAALPLVLGTLWTSSFGLVCSVVAAYQIGSAIMTWRSLKRDQIFMAEILEEQEESGG